MEHLSSVYSETLMRAPDLPLKDINSSLALIHCNSAEVKSNIDALDIHKGCGSDSIPPTILRHCSDLLSDMAIESLPI